MVSIIFALWGWVLKWYIAMERCRNTQRTCKHAYAQTSPHILIQKANSNDMLIWCVTSEEGRNQASAHEATSTTTTEKKNCQNKKTSQVDSQILLKVLVRRKCIQHQFIIFESGLGYLLKYLFNIISWILLKLNQIPNCLTQLIVNLFGMIPQAKSLIIVLD